MRTIIHFTLFTCLSLSLLSTQLTPLAHAKDEVSPPPTSSNINKHEHDDTELEHTFENESNLTKTLAPPTQTNGVDVRTYLRESDQAKITEYSSHGRVFRIKVQPKGGFPAYYLEDDNGDGKLNKRLPGTHYKRINPPMWIIKRF